MPLADPRDQPRRDEPDYSDSEITAMVRYVSSFGGRSGEPVPSPHPESADTAEGQKLFTDNCAGCHQVVGEGGVVLQAVAPELQEATPTEIAEAIRTGPHLMPVFGRRQLDDSQVDSVIRYLEYARDPDDPGGWGIGHIGPIPEGLAAWLVAGLGLVGVTRLIGKRMSGA
jgi:ubiquinol-cytochrome c reductase cytochrome c subunit